TTATGRLSAARVPTAWSSAPRAATWWSATDTGYGTRTEATENSRYLLLGDRSCRHLVSCCPINCRLTAKPRDERSGHRDVGFHDGLDGRPGPVRQHGSILKLIDDDRCHGRSGRHPCGCLPAGGFGHSYRLAINADLRDDICGAVLVQSFVRHSTGRCAHRTRRCTRHRGHHLRLAPRVHRVLPSESLAEGR